jgi:Ca-activated chloride channel family protein
MRKKEMIQVVEGLRAAGQSYGDDAVNIAYELALKNFIAGGNNEIILATDGIFNTPKFNQKSMERMIAKQLKFQNILFSTIGFGRNNYAHDFLQSLSSKGSGSYTRVNSQEEIDEGVINGVLSHSRRRNL